MPTIPVPDYDDLPGWAQLGLFLLATLGTASMLYLQYEGERRDALCYEDDDAEEDEFYEQAYQHRKQRRSA